MTPYKFNMGARVEDKMTGYTGRITAIAKYADGDVIYLVETLDSTGAPVECWVQEYRLEEA